MGTERYDELRTPYGRPMLWSYFQQPTSAEPDSDVQAALDGYVAVTPARRIRVQPFRFRVVERPDQVNAKPQNAKLQSCSAGAA